MRNYQDFLIIKYIPRYCVVPKGHDTVYSVFHRLRLRQSSRWNVLVLLIIYRVPLVVQGDAGSRRITTLPPHRQFVCRVARTLFTFFEALQRTVVLFV